MATVEDPKTATKFKVIGTRPIRPDGVEKVTGRAIYGNDIQLAGQLFGNILRSPHAHARIKSIDTSEAEKIVGVFAVVTSKDLSPMKSKIAELGEGAVDLHHLTQNVMARDKVLYKGHPVAAVAAKDPHTAELAASKIKVEYEVLPAVTWCLDAMKEDAPLLLDDLYTDEMGQKASKPSNVSKHIRFEKGDITQGFAEADVVVEREFKTATVHQGYIEPHVTTAQWNADGHLKIWTSTQGSFTVRQQIAELLEIPVSRILVTPTEIGGGFGGKIRVYEAPVCALLSRKSGRPVKISMTRQDVFESTGPTPGSFIRVKLGAKKDGTLVAGEAWLAYDAGAFPAGIIGPGCMCIFSCYDLPHAKVDGYDVVLNKPQTSAYRAPGATNAAFACESVIDELAEKLGIDPLQFRLQNAAKEGVRRVDGPVYPRVGLVETIEAAQKHDHYLSPLPGPNRGRGVAVGYWFNAGLKSSASATVNQDGSVCLMEGSTDIGGSRASLAMQLAETLGLAAEDINPQVGDTDSVGYTDVTGGSRVTYATGMACYECGLDIIQQMAQRAALLWECAPDDVQFDSGTFSSNGNSISFKELASKIHSLGGPIVGSATVDPHSAGGAFATHIVDVEVDPETGKVSILRYTAIQDCGRAIHPSYVEGQIQGGTVQGIGWGLNEEYFYDDTGRMRNASYLDYRMPTMLDVPMIDAVIVEVPNPVHPFGVRGVGEVPIVPPPAALNAAIHNAVGVRMLELPMAPHKVCKAIQEKG